MRPQSTPRSSSHCVAPNVFALVGISTCPHPQPPGQDYLKNSPPRGIAQGGMVTARIEPCITKDRPKQLKAPVEKGRK